MAQIHHGNHDLPAKPFRLAGILKKGHFSASFTFFHHNNLVGDIPHDGQLVQHLINRDKHRHALGQTVFRSQPEVRQQRGQSRAVFDAPGEFRVASLDGFFLEALDHHGAHGLDEHGGIGEPPGDHVKNALYIRFA